MAACAESVLGERHAKGAGGSGSTWWLPSCTPGSLDALRTVTKCILLLHSRWGPETVHGSLELRLVRPGTGPRQQAQRRPLPHGTCSEQHWDIPGGRDCRWQRERELADFRSKVVAQDPQPMRRLVRMSAMRITRAGRVRCTACGACSRALGITDGVFRRAGFDLDQPSTSCRIRPARAAAMDRLEDSTRLQVELVPDRQTLRHHWPASWQSATGWQRTSAQAACGQHRTATEAQCQIRSAARIYWAPDHASGNEDKAAPHTLLRQRVSRIRRTSSASRCLSRERRTDTIATDRHSVAVVSRRAWYSFARPRSPMVMRWESPISSMSTEHHADARRGRQSGTSVAL